jgi:hypothetical protein
MLIHCEINVHSIRGAGTKHQDRPHWEMRVVPDEPLQEQFAAALRSGDASMTPAESPLQQFLENGGAEQLRTLMSSVLEPRNRGDASLGSQSADGIRVSVRDTEGRVEVAFVSQGELPLLRSTARQYARLLSRRLRRPVVLKLQCRRGDAASGLDGDAPEDMEVLESWP